MYVSAVLVMLGQTIRNVSERKYTHNCFTSKRNKFLVQTISSSKMEGFHSRLQMCRRRRLSIPTSVIYIYESKLHGNKHKKHIFMLETIATDVYACEQITTKRSDQMCECNLFKQQWAVIQTNINTSISFVNNVSAGVVDQTQIYEIKPHVALVFGGQSPDNQMVYTLWYVCDKLKVTDNQ